MGIRPKILVVSNPGNPSGAVLTEGEIEGILRFCEEHSLLIIAD